MSREKRFAGILIIASLCLLGFTMKPGPDSARVSAAGSILTDLPILLLGLLFGLKHAVEADHLAAVWTISSESKGMWRASLVGGMWGLGHTISLMIVGAGVLLLRLDIGPRTARLLEFLGALMLIVLGANAIRRLWRGGKVHFHTHRHGDRTHSHPHFHDGTIKSEPHSHHSLRLNPKPVVVGMVHGLAGSAALMLLVLATIQSRWMGLIYILVFGLGSIGGMMLMSALITLPTRLAEDRFSRANFHIRLLAGCISLALGVLMAYRIGFEERLFG